MGLLNPGGPIAQSQRNRCSIPPVEVISPSGVRKGEACGEVTQHTRHSLDFYPVLECDGCEGVAEVMESDLRNASPLQYTFEHIVDTVRGDGATIRRGKHMLLMNPYFGNLKAHIKVNPPNFGDGESVLTMLYECYNEHNPYDNEQIKADFNELYQQMNGMPLREMDNIAYSVCKLCRDHERAGFIEGIRSGILLAHELSGVEL